MTPGVQRWFDGTAWSETTRPVAPPPVAPAPVASYGGDPRFGAYTQTAPFGSSFAQPTSTLPLGRLVDETAVRSARRATLWALAVGVGALVVGGVLAIVRARALELGLTQSSGHVVATGGLISAAIAFVRAGRSYRVMVDQGGTPWSPLGKSFAFGAAGLALVLAVTGVVQVARASSLAPMGPAIAGSCWSGAESGGVLQALQVRCETAHQYVGTLVVLDASGAECPEQTDSVLDLNDGTGFYLCLAVDPSTGT